MNAAETLAALRAESRRRKYFVRLEIFEQTASLIKVRLYISADLFVQIYRNDNYETVNLALIRNGQRLYARDQLGGRRHRHTHIQPDEHDVSPEGRKAVTVDEFLDESEFVSLVAHELKNPMTSIKGYTELLAASAVGPINAMQTNFLNTILSNVERMNTLVSDLNDNSKIEAGRLRLEFKAIALSEVLDEVTRSSKRQIDEKKQAIAVMLPPNLPKIWADPTRLAQVLINLVSNANAQHLLGKYTPEAGRINIRAEPSSNQWDPEGAPQVVHVWVKDSGIGISLLGATPLVGFSTPAGLTSAGSHPHSVVVALLSASDAKADVQWLAGYTHGGHEAVQGLAGLLSQNPTQTALLFADGFNGDAEQLCASLPPDERLYNAVHAEFERIRWLGEK